MHEISARTHRDRAKIDSSKWANYLLVGVAGALAAPGFADGDITYVEVNQFVDHNNVAGSAAVYAFDLAGGANISFANAYVGPDSEAFAGFLVDASVSAMFGGYVFNGYNNSFYVGRYSSGGLVSAVDFIANQSGNLYGSFGFMASQYWGPFIEPGIGFLGFKFDVGQGTQYGWAQVEMDGPQGNSFTIIDYAFADAGEAIQFGQLPEPNSLGILALGYIGLVAWRRRRRDDSLNSL